MKPRPLIETAEDLQIGAAHLARLSGTWSRLIAATHPLPLRRKPQGFATLLDAIVGQQVSTASAAAIWSRVQAAGLDDEAALRNADPARLAGCGLSKSKIRYAKALAEARLDWVGLAALADDDLIGTLTQITGIGPWSAEIYALSALGRADILPAGDLALQESARLAFGLAERPSTAALRKMALPWAPYRSVAARALWAYYRLAKQSEGIR